MPELWPHQKTGSEYLTDEGSGLLLWEPRCGKTYASSDSVKDEPRVLIICPNSAKFVWEADFQALTDRKVAINSAGSMPSGDVVAINYESVISCNPLRKPWDAVIFDEIHRLGNWQSAVARYFLGGKLPRRRIGLTGTLCPEGYHRAITPFEIVLGQWFWHTPEEGEHLWGPETRANWRWDGDKHKYFTEPHHPARIEAWLSATTSRLTQAQAGIQANKTWRTVYCPAGDTEKIYRAAKEDPDPKARFAKIGQAGSGIRDGKISVKVPKLEAAMDYCAEAWSTGTKFILVAYHTAVLDYLHTGLVARRISHGLISGADDGSPHRRDEVRKLNSGEHGGILAQVECVQEAINLSAADILVFAENSWRGVTRIQVEERMTCRGKERALEMVDFCTRFSDGESLDSKKAAVVRMKQDFNYRILSL